MGKKKIAVAILIVVSILAVLILTLGMRGNLAQAEVACNSFYNKLIDDQKAMLEKGKQVNAELLIGLEDDNSTGALNQVKLSEIVNTVTGPSMLEGLEWVKEKNSELPRKSDSWNYFELADSYYKRVGILIADDRIIEYEAIAQFSFFRIAMPYTDKEGKKSSELLSPAAFSGIVSKAERINPAKFDFAAWCERPENIDMFTKSSGQILGMGDIRGACAESVPVFREFVLSLKEKFDSAKPNSFDKAYLATEILAMECSNSPADCKLKN